MTNLTQRFRVEIEQTLAQFLQNKLGISGKKARRLLEKNCCKVNGRMERFGSKRLIKGQVIEFTLIEETVSSWEILLDREHFSILSKPAGWVCSQANCQNTFQGRYFLVHRLDKDTTGALLVAKDFQTRDSLISLFAERKIEKIYYALVDKVIEKSEGIIDNFLAKKGSFQGQTIWGSSSSGDRAITCWKVLTRGIRETLVECRPVTGRTHQIRVHMAELGHPILGDRQYAKNFYSRVQALRPLLHAYRLEFTFDGESIDVICPLSEDFEHLKNQCFKI